MKKKTETKPREMFEDKIKQTLTATLVPTYDWMYELGLNGTQLGIYAYIFNVCKREPKKAHKIETRQLADVFHLTPSAVTFNTTELARRELLFRESSKCGCCYSLYPLD